MVTIGIRELRQNASLYVHMAREGKRIAVTDRGVLVAYLVPTDEGVTLLDRLEAAGDYTPPAGSVLDMLPVPAPPPGTRPLSQVVEELRGQERW